MTSATPWDEPAAVQGARWVTAAFLGVGLLNYAYVLVLTRLLDVAAYSRFAAGQALLLWAATVAAVSVPWVLAQALAQARTESGRNAAIRFAMVVSACSGTAGAFAVGIIAAQFAGPVTAAVLAASTFLIFLGTTVTGSLQGQGRMRTLSAVTVAENLVKNAAGLLLVVAAGLADTGALAGFGIGALVLMAWWPSVPPGGASWRSALTSRRLWRRASGIAGIQGMVTLVATVDVVLVALLPANAATAASYQASAALSRVPLFVASAVATAFFPSLSRQAARPAPGPASGPLTTRATRMYAQVALPLAVILVTMPAAVLAVLFPAQYGAMAYLLRFTAVTGLAAGGLNLVTTFFQAAGDYSCLRWQGAGLAVYAGALLAGWQAGGITGLAMGGALGAVTAFALVCYCLARRQGLAAFAGVPVAAPVVVTGALLLARPYPAAWLAVAAVAGVWACVAFLRRSAGQRRAAPEGATSARGK
jgi:O-antigen/teichoic acid export membrane protein